MPFHRLAGQPLQIDEIEASGADEHAGVAAGKRGGTLTGILERVPGKLQQPCPPSFDAFAVNRETLCETITTRSTGPLVLGPSVL